MKNVNTSAPRVPTSFDHTKPAAVDVEVNEPLWSTREASPRMDEPAGEVNEPLWSTREAQAKEPAVEINEPLWSTRATSPRVKGTAVEVNEPFWSGRETYRAKSPNRQPDLGPTRRSTIPESTWTHAEELFQEHRGGFVGQGEAHLPMGPTYERRPVGGISVNDRFSEEIVTWFACVPTPGTEMLETLGATEPDIFFERIVLGQQPTYFSPRQAAEASDSGVPAYTWADARELFESGERGTPIPHLPLGPDFEVQVLRRPNPATGETATWRVHAPTLASSNNELPGAQWYDLAYLERQELGKEATFYKLDL